MKAVLVCAVLAACGDNIRPGSGNGGGGGDGGLSGDAIGDGGDGVLPDGHVNGQCDDPLPPTVRDDAVVVAVASDADPSANPTPTTRIAFTVMLPARCPGDAFPLVLHSHGYGSSRLRALAADGTLHPEEPHFKSISSLAAALPHHGYVVLSFDERGHGESVPASGGGYARLIDPLRETADARAILDWAYDHADELAIQREATGIAKDIKVGTLGYSYGGGYQFTLAALDARVDTIVPNGTWHHLVYSVMPGDTVKLSYDGLLCLLAMVSSTQNTPIVQTLCNAVGIASLTASTNRSRADLVASVSGPGASPRPVSEQELIGLLDGHGMGYFQRREAAGLPWGYGEPVARLRPFPALILQGNRDILFNLTEALWNARYLRATGADVRLLSTEGGHMNPLVNQLEGTAGCGSTRGVEAIKAWFDHHLKGADTIAAIPKTCISVADTRRAQTAPPRGLVVERPPVGAQTGTGAIEAKLASGAANLPLGTVAPVFVPVTTITGAGRVLAGVPTIGSITVTPGTGALQSTNAFVGIGIKRGGTTILVDDQVTAFTAGTHTQNRNVLEDPAIWLPAVGEQLRDGDVVGLLFHASHVQYAAVVSAAGLEGAPGVVNYVGDTEVPPVTSGLNPILGLTYVNPYSVTVSDVQLPIIIPGVFPGSALH